MAEPVFGDTTERMWARVPEYVRVADAQHAWTLKTWLAGASERLDEVSILLDRLAHDETDGRSELADPILADAVWLPWLAQLVGVRFDPVLTEAERRNAITASASGWRAGTKAAIAEAAQTELTGTKYAVVYDHSTADPLSDVGSGTMWDVLIVTRTSETPVGADVLGTIERKGAKPAGVTLHWRAYEASWDTITRVYPTWTALEVAGTWDRIEEAGF